MYGHVEVMVPDLVCVHVLLYCEPDIIGNSYMYSHVCGGLDDTFSCV